MAIVRNLTLTGSDQRPFLLDVSYPANAPLRGRIVFVHGFKGFKDWGHWHLLAQKFVEAGYLFAKFNFSHNGTTPEAPEDFVDLEAFGNNNFSRELYDLQVVLDWLDRPQAAWAESADNSAPTVLIGHSRGGPIALLQAAADERIRAVVTWASVSQLDYAWPDEAFLKKWQQTGSYSVVNGRTGQKMPLYYQLYEDYTAAGDRFNTRLAAQALRVPWLIVHGTADPAVPVEAAKTLHDFRPEAQLEWIEGANHVFGGTHPFPEQELPAHSRQLAEVTLDFCQQALT